jgi:hypothetical protein
VNKNDVSKHASKDRLIKEFLVPESGDSEIYFECLRERSNPYVGCIGFADFGQNLSVEFQFKRSEFEKWREMRRAALTLLTSFVKPNGQ